jgi:hypothetical protein
MIPAPLLGVLVSFARPSNPSGGTDWPQFRGPAGTGVVPAADIPLEWSATKNLAWKTAVSGQGWSQPVVIGGTLYLAIAVGEGLETPMGMTAGVAAPRTMKAGATPDVTIDWRVLALDLATTPRRPVRTAQKPLRSPAQGVMRFDRLCSRQQNRQSETAEERAHRPRYKSPDVCLSR